MITARLKSNPLQFDPQILGPPTSMNSHKKPHSDFPPRLYSEQMNRLLTSAHSVLEQSQPPPPSLREILTAYRTKGDGDRDMLLAMLSAKTAEDQRISSVASLHRTMLEICQQATPSSPEHLASPDGPYHYSTPSFTQSPLLCDQQSSRHSKHRPHVVSHSRSPINHHSHLPSVRDVAMTHHPEHPRKRHRSSHSPHRSRGAAYETSHPEQFPPSPYSSSNRSESAEYSPRSRGSMTIGSLLSSRPNREANGDVSHQERE